MLTVFWQTYTVFALFYSQGSSLTKPTIGCDTSIPTSANKVSTSEKYCYYKFEDDLTFDDTSKTCTKYGLHVIEFDDQTEWNEFCALGNTFCAHPTWLGLKKTTTLVWTWIKSQSTILTSDVRFSGGDLNDYAYMVDSNHWAGDPGTAKYRALCKGNSVSKCDATISTTTTTLSNDQRYCYYEMSATGVFDVAQKTCQSHGMTVLEFDNDSEWNEFCERMCTQQIWLGLQKTSSAEWTWITSRSTVVATDARFDAGAVNDYAYIQGPQKWGGNSGTASYKIVCKKQSSSVEAKDSAAVYQLTSGTTVYIAETFQTRTCIECLKECSLYGSSDCAGASCSSDKNCNILVKVDSSSMATEDCGKNHCYLRG